MNVVQALVLRFFISDLGFLPLTSHDSGATIYGEDEWTGRTNLRGVLVMVHHGHEAFEPAEVQSQRQDVPYGIQSASEWAWTGCGENSGPKSRSNRRAGDKAVQRRDRAASRVQQSGGCFDSRPAQTGGCAGIQRGAQPGPQQLEIYDEEGFYVGGTGAPPPVYERPQIPAQTVVPADQFGRSIVVPQGDSQIYVDDDLGVPTPGYAVPHYDAPPSGPGLLPGSYDRHDGPPSGPGLLQYEFPPPGPGLLQGYFNRYETPPAGPGLLQYETPPSGPGLLQGYFGPSLEYE